MFRSLLLVASSRLSSSVHAFSPLGVNHASVAKTVLKLPPLPSLDNKNDMKKMFFSSTENWIIPGLVLGGESPSKAPSITERVQRLRFQGNVTTFVCLQAEVSPHSSAVHLGGIEDGNETSMLPSYADIARQQAVGMKGKPKFIYYGIRDEQIASSVQDLRYVVDELVKRLKDGEVLFIHCKGGFGRTGLVGGCLLSCLYPQLTSDQILERIYNYCAMRWTGLGNSVPKGVKSPETNDQCQQLREFKSFDSKK